jgi:hypothetical protein
MSKDTKESDGGEEFFALAFNYFLECGQFQFFELSLEDQLKHAKAAQLSEEELVKALQWLASYTAHRAAAQREIELAAASPKGKG